jgi:hypothetical protein
MIIDRRLIQLKSINTLFDDAYFKNTCILFIDVDLLGKEFTAATKITIVNLIEVTHKIVEGHGKNTVVSHCWL